MEGSNRGRLRFLAVLHMCVAIALLPLSYVFGLLLVPIIVLVPVWLIVLGVRLWRGSPKTLLLLSRTHYVLIALGPIMIANGIYCLWRTHQSAMEGGGLLGAVGAMPVLYGFLLMVVSVTSFLLGRMSRKT